MGLLVRIYTQDDQVGHLVSDRGVSKSRTWVTPYTPAAKRAADPSNTKALPLVDSRNGVYVSFMNLRACMNASMHAFAAATKHKKNTHTQNKKDTGNHIYSEE